MKKYGLKLLIEVVCVVEIKMGNNCLAIACVQILLKHLTSDKELSFTLLDGVLFNV